MAEPNAPAEKIDYARPGTSNANWWGTVVAWFSERISGVAEFVGQLIGALGSTRQIGFALGLAMLAGGYGVAMHSLDRGPGWMFLGALLVGLSIPLKSRN